MLLIYKKSHHSYKTWKRLDPAQMLTKTTQSRCVPQTMQLRTSAKYNWNKLSTINFALVLAYISYAHTAMLAQFTQYALCVCLVVKSYQRTIKPTEQTELVAQQLPFTYPLLFYWTRTKIKLKLLASVYSN